MRLSTRQGLLLLFVAVLLLIAYSQPQYNNDAPLNQNNRVESINIDNPNIYTPLKISMIELERNSDSSLTTVRVAVHNPGENQYDGRVWIMFAPPFTDLPAWESSNYEAPDIIFDINSNQSNVFEFLIPEMLLSGYYQLSAWVHYQDENRQWQHSDSYQHPLPVYVGEVAAQQLLFREETIPAQNPAISVVEHVLDVDNQSLTLDLRLENNAPQVITGAFALSFIPENNAISLENSYFNTSFHFADVDDDVAIRLRDFIDVPPGRYQVILWIYTLQDGEFSLENLILITDELMF